MEIKKAEFTLSAPRESMCPKDTKPEYAFIGRSNVGKSSLINMLTNNKKLAKTSATPGKTFTGLWLCQALKERDPATRADDQRLYPPKRTAG